MKPAPHGSARRIARVRLVTLVGSAILLVLVAGCGDEDEEVCSAEIQPSARVLIVDPSGKPVPDAVLRVRIQGRPEPAGPVPCNREPGTTTCATWTLFTVPGTTTLTATRADGSSPTEKTVTIANRGTETCQVAVFQEITVVLEP